MSQPHHHRLGRSRLGLGILPACTVPKGCGLGSYQLPLAPPPPDEPPPKSPSEDPPLSDEPDDTPLVHPLESLSNAEVAWNGIFPACLLPATNPTAIVAKPSPRRNHSPADGNGISINIRKSAVAKHRPKSNKKTVRVPRPSPTKNPRIDELQRMPDSLAAACVLSDSRTLAFATHADFRNTRFLLKISWPKREIQLVQRCLDWAS